MSRVISLNRRRPNLIDLSVRPSSGTGSIRFSVAANFDAAPVPFATIPVYGYKSKSISGAGAISNISKGQTRFIFDPDDYIATVPALADAKPFWLSIAEIPFGGAAGPESAPHLVLPFASTPNRMFTISGNVAGTTTEIQLPQTVSNPLFQVSTADLLVGFEPDGTTFKVIQVATYGFDYSASFPMFSQLFMKSSGAGSKIEATFRLVNSLAF